MGENGGVEVVETILLRYQSLGIPYVWERTLIDQSCLVLSLLTEL